MGKRDNKRKNIFQPVENHESAAWANIEEIKNISNVTIPGEMQAYYAKEYVDENEK